mmetsp:Transcript_11145/g.46526  ORF Transcript_11145/g.46526 Transcript_11145/m.46526 type:complete len:414 (-) Transcript_11145:99-1340(-)|eukprot:CAMPEP_0113959290 /NCGR_PEP_ID=MMETSP0011_2-20120614/4060_1 /TAXON_ID=101924 /ORGANISM="Rhodosorus marinus" /LENGTH=413 /DNA_ID=CAMNT_0000970581 /DNA_START=501 /DNA_END=1742 /DNA_ORIENTATION=+ /assembly_acc=CAM_ASM_000156
MLRLLHGAKRSRLISARRLSRFRGFVDVVRLNVVAGKGGDGASSFYTDKKIHRGPADGERGGDGGSVYIEAHTNAHSDLSLSGKRIFKAEHGGHGGGKDMIGARGKDLTIQVPSGTLVYEQGHTENRIIADLVHGDRFMACRGGRGGRGNRAFQTSTNRNVNEAEAGSEGETRSLVLELKSVADVGLVGFPNAGKSTLLASMSSAKPRVASFPFTTLHPVVGVISRAQKEESEDEFDRVTIADLPGILEDAHRGRGLGLNFLRHIERTDVLVYVLDMTVKSPVEELTTLFKELDEYMNGLRQSRLALIVANKLDAADEGQLKLLDLIEWLAKEKIEVDVCPCSARLGRGVDEIKSLLFELLQRSGRSRRKLSGLKMLPFRKPKAPIGENGSAGRENKADNDSMLTVEWEEEPA